MDHNAELTTSEIASLWGSYLNDSMAVCVIEYFLAKVEDAEIRSVLVYALHLSRKHIQNVTTIFEKEQMVIPQGFTGMDVDVKAPRLYSDIFKLVYIQNMSKLGLNSYSMALSNAFREDVAIFYTECLESAAELFNTTSKVMLLKGIIVRAPQIPLPKTVDFVKKQNFITGWFGNRRPLTTIEVGNLFFNIQRNVLESSLLTGFSQVAKSQDVREYMDRGKDIAAKHIEIFGSILTESALPSPMTWDAQATESTVPPFSDKLMMFHTTALIATGISHYATAMAACMRQDISAHYVRLTTEIAAYGQDGANLIIENGWMEQPPLVPDRRALTNV
jgi:hypothetical protein